MGRELVDIGQPFVEPLHALKHWLDEERLSEAVAAITKLLLGTGD